MQTPTLQGVRIRSTRDALLVFHAVAIKRLPLITRRLDAEERRSIVSGNVYVWEERGANTEPTGLGMERWTDGMGWGPSRVRDEFLFYHQKESSMSDDLINPVTPWAQMIRKREQSISQGPGGAFSSSMQSLEAQRLVKQTYSVHVSLPADAPRGITRKWHLTAYFSQHRLDALDTIDRIGGIGDVVVPDGWFRSARTGKMRRDHRNPSNQDRPPDLVIRPDTSHLKRAQIKSPNSRNQISPTSQHRVSVPPPLSDHSRDQSPSSSEPYSPHPGSYDQGMLVPLEYLQNVSGARRNPVDEQFLRRFSSQAIASLRHKALHP